MDNEYILHDIIDYCDEITLKKLHKINTFIKKIIMNDVRLRTITLYGFDDMTCFYTIVYDDLESLQYARAKGLPLNNLNPNGEIGDYDALKVAACRGHLECLKYIVNSEQASINNYRFESLIDMAIRSNHFECVKYLLPFYDPVDKIFGRNTFCENTVRYCSFECLKYLCEYNIPVGYAADTALEYKKYDCIEYLISLGYVPDAWKIPKEYLDLVIQTIKNNVK